MEAGAEVVFCETMKDQMMQNIYGQLSLCCSEEGYTTSASPRDLDARRLAVRKLLRYVQCQR